jgi:hypothetical protein
LVLKNLEASIKIETKFAQMDEVVKSIRALQCKCDSQAGMVEAFKGLLAKGDTKEKVIYSTCKGCLPLTSSP